MCRLRFTAGMSCGPSQDCHPGIGFDMISEAREGIPIKGKFYHGTGVFSRSDAKHLADMINEFLVRNPVAS